AGVPRPLHPGRMDSEGLLALPQLREVNDLDIGRVPAPEGRSFLTASLQERGARVLRADVYDRVPVAPSPRAVATLRALPDSTPLLLALSSGLALETLLDALPADVAGRLRRARVSAASARQADLARRHGFEDVVQAADARPASLMAAAICCPALPRADAGPGFTWCTRSPWRNRYRVRGPVRVTSMTLIRNLVLWILLAAAGALLAWMALGSDHGHVLVRHGGYDYTTTLVNAIAIALGIAVALGLLVWLLGVPFRTWHRPR